MSKIKIKKGDNVKVMTGRSKGHVGRVISMSPSNGVAWVEGANIVSKHTKPNNTNADGGIVKQEASINISNLMLVDSKGNASRVGVRVDKKTGKKNRYFKKSGEIIK